MDDEYKTKGRVTLKTFNIVSHLGCQKTFNNY